MGRGAFSALTAPYKCSLSICWVKETHERDPCYSIWSQHEGGQGADGGGGQAVPSSVLKVLSSPWICSRGGQHFLWPSKLRSPHTMMKLPFYLDSATRRPRSS